MGTGVTGDIYFRGGIPQSRYCGGCAHYQRLCASDSHNVSGARVCLYILDMNHSRGCAAGPGCTPAQDTAERVSGAISGGSDR